MLGGNACLLLGSSLCLLLSGNACLLFGSYLRLLLGGNACLLPSLSLRLLLGGNARSLLGSSLRLLLGGNACSLGLSLRLLLGGNTCSLSPLFGLRCSFALGFNSCSLRLRNAIYDLLASAVGIYDNSIECLVLEIAPLPSESSEIGKLLEAYLSGLVIQGWFIDGSRIFIAIFEGVGGSLWSDDIFAGRDFVVRNLEFVATLRDEFKIYKIAIRARPTALSVGGIIQGGYAIRKMQL